jgi:ParB family transcriptional regulator, chromosome partitioning protein
MAAKHAGLGRGLSALIKDTPPEKPVASAPASASADSSSDGVRRVPVSAIHKSPWQPRRHFDATALQDLVASIRERGVLQPLLVRAIDQGYQLIAGERRFRAAQEAELADVPVLVLDVSDKEAAEIALIENLQREDLNPIEEAEGYQSLADTFGMTQEQIAERVGKGRATIANAVRLLSLPDAVRQAVSEGQLSAGHAKVLLSLTIPREQELLAQRVIKEALSVRALERLVNRQQKPATKPARSEHVDIPATHLRHVSDQLHQALGTSVRLTTSKTLGNGKKVPGRVEIDFYSPDDLDRLLNLLGVTESL